MNSSLQHVALIFESRLHWVERQVEKGWNKEDAKIASYWLLSDKDVHNLVKLIEGTSPHIKVIAYEINRIDDLLDWIKTVDRSSVIIWNTSDGLRRFRGSLIPALSRLLGIPYFGSPIPAQALAQDRFKLSAVAREAGVPVPRGFLARGAQVVSADHTVFEAQRFFVKTNSYGNKVGLRANAITMDIPSAFAASSMIESRFKDDALIQEYLPGMELRATCLRGPNGMDFSLCRVDFFDQAGQTLQHYEINSDGYIGNDHFTPLEMAEGVTELEVLRLYREIGDSVQRMTKSFGLRDYWAMDFRLDEEGRPRLIDLNTGAFPKGDAFGYHAQMRHGLSFGQALVRALHLSHEQSLIEPLEE